MLKNLNLKYVNNLNVFRENLWKLHWNVTGPIFLMIHRWLDEQYDTFAEFVDTVAEHTKGLGANPLSDIPKEEYFITPLKSHDIDAEAAVEYLRNVYEVLQKKTDEMNIESEQNKDFAGVQIYSEISKYIAKQLYFIRQTLK